MQRQRLPSMWSTISCLVGSGFLASSDAACMIWPDWHERTATPSRCTVQAPHRPAPQPNLVPIICSCSRMTQSKGVSSAVSTWRGWPLTVSVIMFPPWLMPRAPIGRPRGHEAFERAARAPPVRTTVHGFLPDAARLVLVAPFLLLGGDLDPANARPSSDAAVHGSMAPSSFLQCAVN